MTKKTVEFNKDLLKPIPNYELDAFNLKILSSLEMVCTAIMVEKDKDYGGSWQQDGIFSVHFNLKRKFDRIHNLFMNGFQASVEDETVLDTLIDLRNYTSLYILYLTRQMPEFEQEFEKLVAKHLHIQ